MLLFKYILFVLLGSQAIMFVLKKGRGLRIFLWLLGSINLAHQTLSQRYWVVECVTKGSVYVPEYG